MIDMNFFRLSKFENEQEVLLPHSLYFTLCSLETPLTANDKQQITAYVLVTKKPLYT